MLVVHHSRVLYNLFMLPLKNSLVCYEGDQKWLVSVSTCGVCAECVLC